MAPLNTKYFLLNVLLTGYGVWGCIGRDFSQGGSVCVCNATYCDLPGTLPELDADEFVTYTSSMGGLRFHLDRGSISHDFYTEGTKLTLNASRVYQTVEGFGGAFTDATGINIASLSEETQNKLLEAYFSPLGIGYTIGRVPIAGSDFSTRPYTYADNENDGDLSNFQLTEEDHLFKLPYIKKAYNVSNGALRILAAAWTAPPWMKTNNDFTGVGSLKETHYSLWAKYHIKFLDAYSNNGVAIWGLSTGNEPLNGDIPLYPFNCMGWTPANLRKWVIEHMGPALVASPFNDTILITYDDQRFEMPAWLKIEFQDERLSDYVSGIGVHWYWDKVAPLNFLDSVHDLLPDKFMLATEACFTKKLNQPVVKLGSWERGETYAESVIDDMNHWVAGWVDWNLALDASGGPNWADNVVDAAVIVNSTADEFYKQPMFYALGHFSKFVPVGSRRIELAGNGGDVKSIAFVTPQNRFVIVLLNKGDLDEKINIETGPNSLLNVFLPAKSIMTVISNLSSSVFPTCLTVILPLFIKMMNPFSPL